MNRNEIQMLDLMYVDKHVLAQIIWELRDEIGQYDWDCIVDDLRNKRKV